MKSFLNISSDLSLPLDFVTQTAAILARKRVGKLPKLQMLIGELRDVLAPLHRLPDALMPLIDTLNLVNAKVELAAKASKTAIAPTVMPPMRSVPLVPSEGTRTKKADEEIKLRTGERKILQVLLQYHPKRLTNVQVGTLTRFPSTGKTYETYKGVLKRNGLIVEHADGLEITERGMGFADSAANIPSSREELFEAWGSVLRAGEREILKLALDAYPHSVSFETLQDRFPQLTGKTLETYIGVLRRNELIETNGAHIRANESFFMT